MTIVKASMAGTVWKILVTEGEQVTAGQDVVILESMKMEIPDLNAASLEAAMSMIAGTARSMGVTVEE